LSYAAETDSKVQPGAENITVSVAVEDMRDEKRWVSVKMDSNGNGTVPIVTDNDVAGLFKEAIETELKNRGFKVGAGGEKVIIGVNRFENEFEAGFYTGEAKATAALSVQVNSPDGTVIFSKLTSARGFEPEIRLYSGANARKALESALRNVVTRLFSDPDFTASLLKGK
jgi:uncharacterized lipoprotein YajG